MAPAVAQTSTATPWVSQTVVSDFPSLLAGPMAVSPSGDVFAASSPNGKVTNKAGDSTAGSDLIAKVNSSGKVLFVLQLGGSYSVSAIAPDAAGNVHVAGIGTASGLPVMPGAYRAAHRRVIAHLIYVS